MSNLWVLPEELGDLAESEYAYEACKAASYLLWANSGRKFSGMTSVTETYRFVKNSFNNEWIFEAFTQGQILGSVLLRPGLTKTTIPLRGRPVVSVDLVRATTDFASGTTDIRIISPDDYFLTDHGVLNFRTGLMDDIEVTYRYGSVPPMAGRMAARTLAKQFALLWEGSDECSLPDRVTSISRQGLTYTILDSQDFIADLRTGVYEVDLFLKTANPDRALRKARVFSPDRPRARRSTPKGLHFAASARDITVPAGGVGTLTIPLADIEGEVLLDAGVAASLVVRSAGASRSIELLDAVTASGANATFSVAYEDVVRVLGQMDPGYWDLYAVLDGVSTHIASGNVRVKLSNSSI